MTSAARRSANLVDHFLDRHIREGRGSYTAIVGTNETCTYSQLTQRVNAVSMGLQNLGVRKNDRVMIVLPDGPDFVSAYLGAIRIGAVAVPTPTDRSPAEYGTMAVEAWARVVITSSESFPVFAPLLGTLPYLRHLVVTGEPRVGAVDWDDWRNADPTDLLPARVSPDEDAFSRWIFPASGPIRAVSYQHGDWTCCCENFATQFPAELTADDIILSASRLSGIFGLGNALMLPLHLGASTVLHPACWRAEDIFDQIQLTRATVLFAPPHLYADMLSEAGHRHCHLGSLKLVVSAGAPLRENVRTAWHSAFGIEILDTVRDFATQKRPLWQHWRAGARLLYGQQVLSWV